MESLTITYKYRVRDLFFIEAKRHFRNLTSKRMTGIHIAFLCLSACFLYAIDAFSIDFYLYTIKRSFLFLFILQGFMLIRKYNDSKKKTQVHPLYSKQCTRTIDKEGITAFFGAIVYKEKWSNLYGFRVTSNAYIINLSKNAEIRLPVSAFKTNEEMLFAEQCIKQINNNKGAK